MAKSVSVSEAKTQFSKLLVDVAAGDEVIITRRGKPVARLAAVEEVPRSFGMDRGRFQVPSDFDAPLSDDLLDAFIGR